MPSLYLHIPFCRRRCAYCDFNTYAGQEALIPDYVSALCREIEFVGENPPSPAFGRGEGGEGNTIFFGGGTPSLLTPHQFEKILQTIRGNFDVQFDAEITLEANPGTVTLEQLRALRALGFNRISFGVQSFHSAELRQLERIHDFDDVLASVDWARRAGFDNLNLDLIYGLPGQPLDRWQATVELAASLRPEHLSLYALTIEPRTPFGRRAARGLLPTPDPDLAAGMYEWAGEYLEDKGYVQYEISNWARSKDETRRMKDEMLHPSSFILPPSYACRHNLQTWRNQPYLGFGAGAHGYAAGIRYSNVLRINTYIESCHPSPVTRHPSPVIRHPSPVTRHPSPVTRHIFPLSPAVTNHHTVSIREEMQETMMLGLRLTREGVSAEGFADRFQVQMRDVFGKEIEELTGLGLLEWVKSKPCEGSDPSQGFIRLTKRGRLLGNQVFMRFI
jgi:oxygen-independent coproporphyrinogen-3 oxidase